MTPDQKDMLLVRVALAVRHECGRSLPAITNVARIADSIVEVVTFEGRRVPMKTGVPLLDVEDAIDRLCALGFAREVTTSRVRVFRWVGP